MSFKMEREREWFDGERIVHIEPEKKTRVTNSWLRRPNLYTGRALTDTTLILNTQYRIRHMKLFGRQMSAGVIRGLNLSFHTKPAVDENDQEKTEQWLRISDGLGLTVYGDDVSLAMTTDVFLENVHPSGNENPPRGAGIFMLEPIEIIDEIAVDNQSQCPWDRERDPLEDEQIIDSCRLVFYPWPEAELGPIPPDSSPRFRNQLAYHVFDYELSHPGELMPWEKIGVALGLTYITSKGVIQFIDQHAVVRQGGAPMTVQPLLSTNGTRFLWEARIQQLISHLYDIKTQTPKIPSAKDHFEVLPPAGVLPKQILDFIDMSTEFFPSQFVVNAVPVPEEQLEVALNASAGLTPFDMHKPEKIKLLVPVPQAVFEPDLLKKEVPDPIFLETLRKLIQQIRKWIANRGFLRDQANQVVGAIDYKDIPTFDEDDPDEIPSDEKKFPIVVQPDADVMDYGQLSVNVIQNLRNWIESNTDVSSSDFDALDPENVENETFDGLDIFVQNFSKNIHTTEEYLSTNFVKTEAEIYRLRQLILGNVKASRLATSTVMGKIVEGQTRAPSVDDVENYFKYSISKEKQADSDTLVLEKDVLTAEKMSPSKVSGKTEDEKINDAMEVITKTEEGETLKTKDVLFAASTLASVLAKRMGDGGRAISMIAQPDKVISLDDEATMFYEVQPPYMPLIYKGTIPYFESQGARREKKIVDRVYESPAMEIKSKAVDTKAMIFESLRKIPLYIDDDVTVSTTDTAVLTGVEYQTFKEAINKTLVSILEDRTRKSRNFNSQQNDFAVFAIVPLTQEEINQLPDEFLEEQITFFEKQLFSKRGKNKVSLKSVTLSKNIRGGIFDPDPTDGDEANYFSAGVTALEHALEAMRVVDHKLDDYRKALKKCKTGLNDLTRNSKKWKDALDEIDDKLSELRHDALVTRSLFEEEKTRIEAINHHRMRILTEYVSALAYVRPRLVEARSDVPAIKLHGEYISPVAACLAEDYEATDELEDMLDMFREVPVCWLKQTQALLNHITHLKHFVDIFKQADLRARQYMLVQPKAPDMTRKAYNTKEFGQSVNKVIYAHQQTRKDFYAQKININVQQLAAMTWKDLKKKAEDDLSLADMIEAGKGKSTLARKATAIMEEIEDIAVCFYNRCNELEPAIRLQWANKISLFDKPINLQHLDVLPSWDKIDAFFRRDLQNMVDWLFSQMDPKISDAQKLMNDLVRVCILLASHAPVSTIVRGYAPEPAKGKIGDVVDMVVDKGIVKIGMVATVFMQSKVAVQGVVEDIAQSSARIKVTHTQMKTGEFAIDQGAQVKFHKRIAGKILSNTG